MVYQSHALALGCMYLSGLLIQEFFLPTLLHRLTLVTLNHVLLACHHLGSHIVKEVHELPFQLILIILHRQPYRICLRIR